MVGAIAAPAHAGPVAHTESAHAITHGRMHTMNEWATVRENYFNTLDSCNKYGYGATGNRSGNGYVAGTTNWYCYRNSGQSKWSIDLYYS